MGNWRFVFMLAVVAAAYVFFAQKYLFPEFSESISRAASDVSFPSTDVGTTVHRDNALRKTTLRDSCKAQIF